MRPLVAVVGRPNVGKSTLVNRLVGKRAAIVDPTAGVTRDRHYLDTDWSGHAFTVVDAGGLDFVADVPLVDAIHEQALLATREADVILFVVDASVGLLPSDQDVADLLRRSDSPVLVVANKLDDPQSMPPAELYGLGFGEPAAVSAIHGTGTGDLLDLVVERLPSGGTEEQADDLAIAVIGRPNAGKSTLVNALLGQQRAVVSDIPGTTRDAIDSVFERDGVRVRVVDTAGLRKKSKTETLEYYGRVRALGALERSDLAVLVVDAREPVADQDQRIVGEATQRGCALVIALNKTDILTPAMCRAAFESAAAQLRFVSWAPIVAISASEGRGLGGLWKAMVEADGAHSVEIPTSRLNALLQQLKASGHTVSKRNKILKLSYAVQTGTRPPRFRFFCNHPELADDAFRRYLEGRLRESFPLDGTPVRIQFAAK